MNYMLDIILWLSAAVGWMNSTSTDSPGERRKNLTERPASADKRGRSEKQGDIKTRTETGGRRGDSEREREIRRHILPEALAHGANNAV